MEAVAIAGSDHVWRGNEQRRIRRGGRRVIGAVASGGAVGDGAAVLRSWGRRKARQKCSLPSTRSKERRLPAGRPMTAMLRYGAGAVGKLGRDAFGRVPGVQETERRQTGSLGSGNWIVGLKAVFFTGFFSCVSGAWSSVRRTPSPSPTVAFLIVKTRSFLSM